MPGRSAAYLEALRAAPGEVRLPDGTPISGCLVEEQGPGALATVGRALIESATALNHEARRGEDRRATVRLGYLVGAVDAGASTTGGIHRDLQLRLNSAARFTPADGRPLGAEFERAFGEGYAAAKTGG
ncbi:MAG: hypothetical protein GEU88_14630 [Solirubrobacterales bacterium]|nr:hypothetical protein [Solirubrobacterales bacterium]